MALWAVRPLMEWSGRAPAPPASEAGKGRQRQGARMFQTFSTAISVVGIDIGKNSFHVVGLDERGTIMLRQKWSRGQVETRFANMPSCLMPATYVRPYSKGQKNDFR